MVDTAIERGKLSSGGELMDRKLVKLPVIVNNGASKELVTNGNHNEEVITETLEPDTDSSSCERLLTTICIYASGLVLGLTSGIVGPTLVHVSILYSSSMSDLSRGIAAANATYFLGSLLTALVFDLFNPRLLHSTAMLMLSVGVALAPFMPQLYGYQMLMAVVAFVQGVVQSSVPALLFNSWQNHRLRSSVLQGYYMVWGSGLFLCPLVAMPFLAHIPEQCRILQVRATEFTSLVWRTVYGTSH